MEISEINPKGDRVLVKVRTEESVTAGGIFLPATNTDREPTLTGTVVKIGGDVKETKPGEEIAFPKFAGNKIHIKSHEYRLLVESDIYGEVVYSSIIAV